MSSLFENTSIAGMTLRNRFVRSATYEGMADVKDGSCTPRLTELMADLARGEVGLIVTGHAYVNRKGQARPGQMGSYSDQLLPGLARMAETVHAAGGTIVMQIAHAGCHSFAVPPGEEALGPSSRDMGHVMARAATKEEISKTVADFANAASRAKQAGFDGVQIHSAHGYFLSQFLSPFYNKRTDEYGGSLGNRARILLEVFRAVRSAVGQEYPVLIKINSDDYLEGGFTRAEMVQVAAMLEKEGIDAIEMSGGTHLSPEEHSFSRITGRKVPEEKEAYFAEAAKLYKEKVKVPLMLVGGIRSLSVAEKVVKDGLADYVSLCRPLVREPDLVRRWRSGDTRKATCISCNQCFKPARAAEGIYCVPKEKLARKREGKD